MTPDELVAEAREQTLAAIQTLVEAATNPSKRPGHPGAGGRTMDCGSGRPRSLKYTGPFRVQLRKLEQMRNGDDT
jgi:hypothetical protein